MLSMPYEHLREHPLHLARCLHGGFRDNGVLPGYGRLLRLGCWPLLLSVAYEAVHLVYEGRLVDAETLRAFLEVGVAQYLVGYYGYGAYYRAYALGPLLRVCLTVEQQSGLELNEVCLMGCYVVSELCCCMLSCEAVGVVVVGEE